MTSPPNCNPVCIHLKQRVNVIMDIDDIITSPVQAIPPDVLQLLNMEVGELEGIFPASPSSTLPSNFSSPQSKASVISSPSTQQSPLPQLKFTQNYFDYFTAAIKSLSPVMLIKLINVSFMMEENK